MDHPSRDPVTYALAQIIQRAIDERGATQSDLARWTGMKQPTVWNKLSGGGDIKVSESVRMLGALGLDFTDTMRQAEEEAKQAEGND